MTQRPAQQGYWPWKLGDPEYDTKGFRKVVGGQFGFHSIAQVVARKGFAVEDAANARLIAAAPDLLAACEALFGGIDEETVTMTYELEQKIRAAIAKAKPS